VNGQPAAARPRAKGRRLRRRSLPRGCRARLGDVPRKGTGPPRAARRASRLLRTTCGGGLRPALSAGASAAPQAGNTGRPQPAPPSTRHVRPPLPSHADQLGAPAKGARGLPRKEVTPLS